MEIESVRILAELRGDGSSMFLSRASAEDMLGVSVVRGRWRGDPRYAKQDMLLVSFGDAGRLASWDLEGEILLPCVCRHEVMVGWRIGGDVCFRLYGNDFRRQWGRRYSQECVAPAETAGEFLMALGEALGRER